MMLRQIIRQSMRNYSDKNGILIFKYDNLLRLVTNREDLIIGSVSQNRLNTREDQLANWWF
ncbi:hypothetical protein SE23_03795 [Vibrio sinaloensis]|nr:hypothetical protein SE23_03795 [Vibrio sinaloensis]